MLLLLGASGGGDWFGSGWFIVVAITLWAGVFLVGNTVYLLVGARHARQPRMRGDATSKPVGLQLNEHVEHTLRAIRRRSTGVYVSGFLYLTDRAVLYGPDRVIMNDTGPAFRIDYESIERWYVGRRWGFGLGSLPMTRRAVVLERNDGTEEVFWPVWGYDLVGMFRRCVPRELAGTPA